MLISQTVETVLVINVAFNEGASERMGFSAIYASDDVSHNDVSLFTKCSSDFHDGGFKKLTNCTGRYLMIVRTGLGMWVANPIYY